ncbi:hypothetical protein POL68_00155 [Stigmatella sp. ncwal1]|uniref:Uncharacterized protein n=1 Tax=Stigmatella ashevillensis TaxID=2995309 RepID=A0ABT5D3Q1_9BACT|nr:hypothetical protein [Stigmatella ashevillena]MDC0706876.1 hypothetical protein [Stigmatella ashevillena]
MTSLWHRRRQPDDVPTPVAVAVSDFCRRAKAAATPTEVREALALLADEDDFRVRSLTDTEPERSPLGPFAVVDILRGTAPELASQRQGCGYYEVVRELARVREEKAPPAPAPTGLTFAAPPAAPSPSSETPPEGSTARAGKSARQAAETLQSRIAPRRREPLAETEPYEAEESVSFKRALPKPRGRFTQVAAPKASYQTLLHVEGKGILESALAQNEHRFALLKSLSEQYNGAKGELGLPDLEGALQRHELMDRLTSRERQGLLAAYTEQRGAAGRVAWSLGLSPSELQRLVSMLQLQAEVEGVRERFQREALGTRHLTQRLDLLGRDKYLADLGIKKRFTEMLRKEMEDLARGELPDAVDLPGLCLAIARKHGAPQELVLRALERLGLSEGLRKQLLAHSNHSSP